VNQKSYLEVLDRLKKKGRCEFKWKLQMTGSLELHHDNTPANTASSIREFLTKKCVHVLPQAFYSPDLSPYDFYLFPKLKLRVKGHRFQTLDSAQKAVTDAIKTLPEADFQSCYEAWKMYWAKCVALEGCYFKGDSVDLDK
jgi:transposase